MLLLYKYQNNHMMNTSVYRPTPQQRNSWQNFTIQWPDRVGKL